MTTCLKSQKDVGQQGQRNFAAAVLWPHAAALAVAVQRQSVAVKLTAHVELLGITVIDSLKCARVLLYLIYHSTLAQ
jgi:hypothetical protein